ncbi:MAG: hypothetical protein HY340_01495 [Candidatus Kerfeldbacteria bacterium]|nr:hypothetical protein [Candidatus Kerfeldbacteria bacterium]
MMENLDFSLEEVFNEVRSRMQTQGALTREEYLDLVDEVLEEKREEGLIDDDYNFKEAREALETRWEEIEDGEVEEVKEEGL